MSWTGSSTPAIAISRWAIWSAIPTGCARVRAALRRIDAGTFGICVGCEESINLKRREPLRRPRRAAGRDRRRLRHWYASHPEVFRQKVDHLATALVGLNGGRGPDILALVEVESLRAAELLMDELNRLLRTPPSTISMS